MVIIINKHQNEFSVLFLTVIYLWAISDNVPGSNSRFGHQTLALTLALSLYFSVCHLFFFWACHGFKYYKYQTK